MEAQTGAFAFWVTDPNVLLMVELVAVISGLFYVVLAVLKKRMAWLWGFTNAVISIWLFYQISLFAESFLYIYYAIAAVYGWFHWGVHQTDRKVTTVILPHYWHFWMIPLGIIMGIGLGFALEEYTEASYPYLDAQTTIFSFIATALTARRVLSNWVYWIAIDLITVVMYSLKDLYWYAGLMVVYTVIAYLGWMRWKRELYGQPS